MNAFLARCTKNCRDGYVTEYAMDYVQKCRRSYVSDQYSSTFEEERLCLHCIQSRTPSPCHVDSPTLPLKFVKTSMFFFFGIAGRLTENNLIRLEHDPCVYSICLCFFVLQALHRNSAGSHYFFFPVPKN